MKRWISNLLLLLISSFFAFFVIEVFLSLLGISYPSFYQYDEYLGAAHRPGAQGLWTKEGRAFVRINSHGFRDKERTYKKPSNTYRIAVLGDSYAEALQVSEDKTFWSVLERKLSSCGSLKGKNVEVLNFGVSGYGTGRELIQLRQKVWKYSPDLVLLAFLTGNDIRNNLRELEKEDSIPYFVYDDGNMTIDASFRNIAQKGSQSIFSKIKNKLSDHSRIFQVINEVRKRVRDSQQLNKQQADAAQKTNDEIGLDNNIYLAPKTKPWKRAWDVTEALIIQMRNDIKKKNADFMIVTLTNGMQVHPDKKAREEFTAKLGVKDLLYPDLRIKQLGETNGIDVFNLVQPFQAYAKKHKVKLHGFDDSGGGHWNEKGHKLAGQLISDKLCSTLGSNKRLSFD